jgi:hypothetical protein
MLVITVELTVLNNNLSGAASVQSAAQLFAIFASIGACLRAYWLHAVDSGTGDDSREPARYHSWPMTYEDWYMLQAGYQGAVGSDRENEMWSRYWRTRAPRSNRRWVH